MSVIITRVTVLALVYFSCTNILQFITQSVTDGMFRLETLTNNALMNGLVCLPACFLSRIFLSDRHRAWKLFCSLNLRNSQASTAFEENYYIKMCYRYV